MLRVDKSRYCSSAFMEQERQALWPRVWLLAGLARDVAEPGRCFTFELGKESVVVVNDGGTLRAFHNACQHRGHALRSSGQGKVAAFRCPYHGWTYGLDGRLRHVPDRDTFASGVPADEFSLAPLGCEALEGLVWIHMGADRPALADYLRPALDAGLAGYDLGGWSLTRDITIEVACNWKVAADAWNESYHAQGIHPQILEAIDDVHVAIDALGPHGRLVMPFATPSPRLRARGSEPRELGPLLTELVRAAGVDPRGLAPADARAAVQAARRGRADYAGLDDAQLSDCFNYYLFPNVTLAMWADEAMLYRYRPDARDPERCLLDLVSFARARRQGRPPHEVWQVGDRRIDQVLAQDLAAMEAAQRGMASMAFPGLELSAREVAVARMHAEIDRVIGGTLERRAPSPVP